MPTKLPSLIRINPPALDLDCQPVYASAHNITGQPLYRTLDCYLHPDAVACLARAVTLAAAHECRLRIFDAWRPPEAQEKLFAACPDPVYIADPKTGSHHNRGVAVDLTLIDAREQPLDMGTGFDAMTPLSAHGADVGTPATENRYLLRTIMEQAGFIAYEDEWWHYELPDARDYPLIADGTIVPLLMRRA